MKLTQLILAGAFACSIIFAGCASNKVPAEGKTTDISTEAGENQDAQEDTKTTDSTEKGGDTKSDAPAPSEKEGQKTEDKNPPKGSGTESGEAKTSETSYTKKSTLKAACDEAKFSMTAPDSIGDYKIKEYMAAEGQAVELVYESNTTGQTIAIKKSLGNLETVGSESEYEVNRFVNDAGNRIFLRGDSINKIYIGTWNSGDYSFSIECPSGLPRESVLLLVREVN